MVDGLKRDVKEVLELPISWGQYTSFMAKETQTIAKRISMWLETLLTELKAMPGEYPDKEDQEGQEVDEREYLDWRQQFTAFVRGHFKTKQLDQQLSQLNAYRKRRQVDQYCTTWVNIITSLYRS